ncbi:beta-glucan synthesis-associated protein [Coprinopsis sp. MPI-PUGE-AT-0042]|nr:beta-glucan synthesis-associated protein [Coprinopsis sp. MPI-PUGE-AT-0042]
MSQRRFYPQTRRTSLTRLLAPARPYPPSRSRGKGSSDSFTSADSDASAPRHDIPATWPNVFVEGRAILSYNTSQPGSISDKFSLSPDPKTWGSNLSPDTPEPDDYLHNPDPKRDVNYDAGGTFFTWRGLTNLGCMIILCLGFLALFAGYPIISHFMYPPPSRMGGFNIGGINATGQIPNIGNFGLIDLDTPQDAFAKPSYTNPKQDLQLVFSDEFNVDNRSFYPGDDPYWEAVDLHYWATNNLEWYDPSAITTRGGFLEITLSRKRTHDLDYQGGMVSSWNKFCFTGGLLEASVTLPGANNVMGLWPAVWSMGNLGRAGYGATLEGMWPYTYDSCDVGTAPNQTHEGLPLQATINGDPGENGALSYLPGQRLSRCTCPGESHPGPIHTDGTFVGRSAPEIDVFEALVSSTDDQLPSGYVSQSAQWGPFNAEYAWFNTTENLIIPNPDKTIYNTYTGGAFQQATSCVTSTNQQCYELAGGCQSIYGFEYKPGFDNAYISWISDGELAWTLRSAGMAADTRVEIAARPVPQEPMYIIMNLGVSENFGGVDFDHLAFPATMRVDWVRVYQPKDAINIGCNPKAFPTQAYIKRYLDAYTNPNFTTWRDAYEQPFPKSRFLGQC